MLSPLALESADEILLTLGKMYMERVRERWALLANN